MEFRVVDMVFDQGYLELFDIYLVEMEFLLTVALKVY